MNDILEIMTEAIERRYIAMSNPDNAKEDAQAALTALRERGIMLCQWQRVPFDKSHREPADMILNAMVDGYKLTGLQPPQAGEAQHED